MATVIYAEYESRSFRFSGIFDTRDEVGPAFLAAAKIHSDQVGVRVEDWFDAAPIEDINMLEMSSGQVFRDNDHLIFDGN